MDMKIAAKKPATKIKQLESILRVWFHDICQDCIQKLISSMPDCCKDPLNIEVILMPVYTCKYM